MKMPSDLMTEAKAVDANLAGQFASKMRGPVTPYAKRSVEVLNKALNGLLTVLGAPLVQGEPQLPDVARALAMVAKAAADYGQPLPVDIENLRSDNELIALASALTMLGKDKDFARWLKEEVSEEPESPEMEGMESVEEEASEPEHSDESIEAMMRKRAVR
jgi:hypothetical protein